MRTPGFSAAASLYESRHQYHASGHYTSADMGVIMSALHWGAITRSRCTHWGCWWTEGEGCGRATYSAILWDIPWGQSWEDTCKRTPGPAGSKVAGRLPTRCVNTWFNIWGEWDNVQDKYCDTHLVVRSG